MGISFSAVPQDVSDEEALRRFLNRLVEQLDVAFGNRGTSDTVATTESLRPLPNVSASGYATEQQNRALSKRIEALERKVGI